VPPWLSLHTALIVGHVISPAAALGYSTPQEGLTTSNTPECISAVEVHVAKALAALALKRALRGDVRLHRDSQAAQLSENAPSTLHIPALPTLQGSGLGGRLWKCSGTGAQSRDERLLGH